MSQKPIHSFSTVLGIQIFKELSVLLGAFLYLSDSVSNYLLVADTLNISPTYFSCQQSD